MKTILIGLGLFLSSNALFGQAPYAGGKGDGYAKTTLVLTSSTPQATSSWVEQEQGVLHLQGIQNLVHWQIFDVVGREVTTRKSLLGTGEARVLLPHAQVATGAYLIKVEIDGTSFIRKWIRQDD